METKKDKKKKKDKKSTSIELEKEPLRADVLAANISDVKHKLERNDGATWKISSEEETKILSLLKSGADIESTGNGDGCRATILYWALWVKNEEFVKTLIEMKANVHFTASSGYPAIHVACALKQDLNLTMLMVDKGADLNQKNLFGQTTLISAVRWGADTELIQYIIDKGIDVNGVDSVGLTALHMAVQYQNFHAALVLLKNGAYAGKRDQNGKNSLIGLIERAPELAKMALSHPNFFHENHNWTVNDRPHSLFDYRDLEPPPSSDRDAKDPPQISALEAIIQYNRLELITVPVIRRLVREHKWKQFARWKLIFQALLYIIFLLSLTIGQLLTDMKGRHQYVTNRDWGRLAMEILTIFLLIYHVVEEAAEFRHIWNKIISRRRNLSSQISNLTKSGQAFIVLQAKLESLKSTSPVAIYFQSRWNRFDMLTYLTIFICIVLRIANVIEHRDPQFQDVSKQYEIDRLMRADSGMIALALLFAWIKVLKFTRISAFFGPFVVMLGEMLLDIFQFVAIWLILLIAFGCAFMAVFANLDSNFNNLFSSTLLMFRGSFGDIDYESLQAIDRVITPMLFIPFALFSIVLFLNMFIAMLNNTFQRVYDRSKDVSEMQFAEIVFGIEESLPKKELLEHREHIHKISPEKLTETSDDIPKEDELKITLRMEIKRRLEIETAIIKEQINGLREEMRTLLTERKQEM